MAPTPALSPSSRSIPIRPAPIQLHGPRIPLTDGSQAPARLRRPVPPADAAALQPARVAVAEDDAAMRQMLVETLVEEGYQVIALDSGVSLLRYLDGTGEAGYPGPDLVVTDVRMPGVDGLTVLERLRRKDWALPVVIITAFGDEAIHSEAGRLGAAQVLDKPFNMEDLVHAVRAVVPPAL